MFPLSLLIIKQLFIAVSFILIFFGLGRLVFNKLKFDFNSVYEEFFFCSSIGITIAIIYISILSIAGILYKPLFLPLLLGLAGLSAIKPKNYNWIFILFLLIIPTAFITLYPPHLWDDIIGHLPFSHLLLHSHRLEVLEMFIYPIFPINGNMLFTSGLLIGPLSAQLLSWICLFTTSIGCFYMVEKRFNKLYALLAFLALFSSPIMLLVGTKCFIDIVLTLFIAGSVFALINFFQERKDLWLYLSGILLGMALGTKYTALIFCVSIFVYFIISRQWKNMFKYLIPVLIFGAPWYIRNFYYSGNPVWPFLFGYSKFWNYFDYTMQFIDLSIYNIPQTINNLLKLPWIFHNFYLEEHKLNIITWTGLIISTLFLIKNKLDRLPVFIAVTYILAWFYSINYPRYLVPVIPIMCMLSAFGFAYIFEKFIHTNKIKIGLILVLIFYCGFYITGFIRFTRDEDGPIPVSSSQVDTFLTRKLEMYKATEYALKSKGNIYGLFCFRAYFYADGYLIGTYIGKYRYSSVITRLDNPYSLFVYLNSLKVKYLLIDKGQYNQYLNLASTFNSYWKETSKESRVLFPLSAKYGVSDVLIFKRGLHKDYYTMLKFSNYFSKVYEDDGAALYKLK